MQKRLFVESWKGEPLRLIGVALTNLKDESFEQLSLFEDNEKKERRRNWMRRWMKSAGSMEMIKSSVRVS